MAIRQELIDDMVVHGFTDEQIEYVDKELFMDFKRHNNYKILTGRKYKVSITEFNNMKFYKILVTKKGRDDELIYANKQVKFVNCEPPKEDGVEIIINNMFEDFYFKKDNKYDAIWTIVITEYKIADKEKREEARALGEFNKTMYDESQFNDDFTLNSNDLIPIDELDDNFLD